MAFPAALRMTGWELVILNGVKDLGLAGSSVEILRSLRSLRMTWLGEISTPGEMMVFTLSTYPAVAERLQLLAVKSPQFNLLTCLPVRRIFLFAILFQNSQQPYAGEHRQNG